MPHKRSQLGRERALASYQKRLQREQDDYDRQTLYYLERSVIWDNAFLDKELKETVNTIVCHQHKIMQGEVLLDTRNRGFFQRIT